MRPIAIPRMNTNREAIVALARALGVVGIAAVVLLSVAALANGPGAVEAAVEAPAAAGAVLELPRVDLPLVPLQQQPPRPLDCTKLLGASHPIGGPGQLFQIDPGTGASVLIGNLNDSLTTEIEFDNLTGSLYVEEVDGLPGLWTVDPETAALLGSVAHAFGALNGMEYAEGTLYATFIATGYGGAPSDLVTVNTSTGVLTTIGPTGLGPISGLAYNPWTRVMYGVTAGGAPADLVTIDLVTGLATVVGPILFNGVNNMDRIGSIEFLNDTLYGGLTGTAGVQPNALIRIDPYSGNATLVGDTGYSITGLTSCTATDLQVAKSCYALIGSESPLPVAAVGEVPEVETFDADGFLDFARPQAPATTPAQKGIAGVEWVCTIDVFNPGRYEVTAGNVVVSDTIPAGVLYSTDTSNSCQVVPGQTPRNPNRLECAIGNLLPGENFSFDIEFVIDPNYVANMPDGQRPLRNEACATMDTPQVPGDEEADNDCDEDTDYVNDRADLTVLKMSKPDTQVRAGEPFSYTIIVENLGPSYARGVYIRDDILFSEGLDLLWLHGDPARSDSCEVVTSDIGRREIVCELLEPLEPVGDWVSDPPGTGRWIIRMTVRSDETQDINNLVRVYTGPNDDERLEVPWITGTVDPDESNNRAEDFISVLDVADLNVSKVDDLDPVTAGNLLRYTLEVTNNGPSTATNVVIKDNLPAEVELVDVSSSDGDCVAGTPGDPLDPTMCAIGEIPSGGTRTIWIDVRVDPDVPIDPTLPCDQTCTRAGPFCRGRIFNDAWVLSDEIDPDLGDNFVMEATDINYSADLQVFKNDQPDTVAAGGLLTYNVIVNNAGPSTARSVIVQDALPDEVELLSAVVLGLPGGGPGMCEVTAVNQVLCELGDIPPGAPPQGQRGVLITVRVKPDTAAGTLDNTATAFTFQTCDPDWGNNTATEETTVVTSADLAIEKESIPSKVYAGEQVKYEIWVKNLGPSEADNVTVTDVLPAGMTYEVDTDNCVEGPPNTLVCSLGDIPAGGEDHFAIWALVDPSVAAGSTLIDTATVGSDTDDPNPDNNTDTAKTHILGNSDLKITKFGKPDGEVRAGEILTYTVIVDNLGPSWATEVAVKDVLQSSGTFDLLGIESNLPGMACVSLPVGAPGEVLGIVERLQVDCTLTPALEVLTAEGGPPNPGRWILTMRVRAYETQDINNVATVTATTPDPNPDNNQARVEHDITDVADLGVTKTAVGQVVVDCIDISDTPVTDLLPNQVTAGLLLTYQMIVTNAGPSTAENVLLIDRLPPGVTVISADVPDGGSCATGTPGSPADRLTCGLGTIGVAASKMVNVVVRVDSSVADGAILENDVFVTSDIFDPDNSDNYGSNLTTVNAQADLSVTKTDQPDPVVAGELLEYTVTVLNEGPSDAQGVVVTDWLPGPVEYRGFRDAWSEGVSCSLNPIDMHTLTCTLGDMAADEEKKFTIVVFVDPNAPPLVDPNDNRVAVTSETQDPCPADNGFREPTEVEREDQVYIQKVDTPDPVMAGTEVIYTITFGNNGPSTAQDVEVVDTLPLGVTFDRCESLDPNDQVNCSVVAGDGNATEQQVRLDELLIANNVAYRWASPPDDELDPGEEYSFRVIADVESGYVLNGRGDTNPFSDPPDVCAPFFLASGYPYYAHNRIDITSNVDDDFDDECTRVEAEADLRIDKMDDLLGFLECDPVQVGKDIVYDILVANDGPSDAAQVYVVDWLPREGVAHDPAAIQVFVSRGDYEIRDDGRIQITAGNDPDNNGDLQLGRMNADMGPVEIQIIVPTLLTAECGAAVTNEVSVETRRNDNPREGEPTDAWGWPPLFGATMYPPTPTFDPDMTNNQDAEDTTIECPAVEVDKTISFDGTCPGSNNLVQVETGQAVTFCFEITNTGTTYLDTIMLTDTLRTRTGRPELYTETFTHGADPNAPIAPGETIYTQVTLPALCYGEDCECGTADDTVEVTAIPVNLGRTVYPCMDAVVGTDAQRLLIPCSGVDTRLALPALSTLGLPPPPAPPSPYALGDELNQALPATNCESWVQVQNVGAVPTMAMVVVWGEAGYCPPQSAGPLKVECSGLLRPGAAWSFAPGLLPAGAESGMVYSLSAAKVDGLEFGHRVCERVFFDVVGDYFGWSEFDVAYREGRVWNGFDFGAFHGEPLAVTVNRTCPDPADPNATGSAMYSAISADILGAPDPYSGGYMYYAPMVFADKGGLNSWIYLQNTGVLCSSLELWFKAQDNCLRPILGDVLSVAPGESARFDPNTVVGPDWMGSAWVRASQPMAMVVDTMGPNHFTSYAGFPADVWSPDPDMTFSLGTEVNYAPLIYNQHQGWDTALIVQNLSSTTAAKAKVYFLDRSGDIIHTLVDWICPRGSQTFFLPVINGLPGNWVGSARVESQNWWTPGDPQVDAPRLQSVVLLEKWADPARSARREAMAYNAATECDVYDWQLGRLRGGVQSGSAVLAVPLVAKDNRGITTELALTNLVPKPGFTDFALFIYDQNGLLDYVCEKLNEKQVEYIDLNQWGWIHPHFMGSAVVSAVFWEHEVFDPQGQFRRNLVGLGGVIVERIGGTQGGPDVPGDESKATGVFPVFDFFRPERLPNCPGLP